MDEAKEHFQASETERMLPIKQKFDSFLAEKFGFSGNDVITDYGAAFPYTLDIPLQPGYKTREKALQKIQVAIDQFIDSLTQEGEPYSEWNESVIGYWRGYSIDGISATVTISKFGEDSIRIRLVQ